MNMQDKQGIKYISDNGDQHLIMRLDPIKYGLTYPAESTMAMHKLCPITIQSYLEEAIAFMEMNQQMK